jgi:hypothetical protein
MRALMLVLMLTALCLAESAGFVSNVAFAAGPLQVRLINYEQPRGKPYLIAHFEIRNPTRAEERCDWMSLCSLERADGSSMGPNYDVLVDSGTGMTRATGPFTVAPGRKVTASVLFILSQGSLPGHLILMDGRRSATINATGRVRWTEMTDQ